MDNFKTTLIPTKVTYDLTFDAYIDMAKRVLKKHTNVDCNIRVGIDGSTGFVMTLVITDSMAKSEIDNCFHSGFNLNEKAILTSTILGKIFETEPEVLLVGYSNPSSISTDMLVELPYDAYIKFTSPVIHDRRKNRGRD